MRTRPVVLRALASQDIEDIVSYYFNETAEQAVMGFVDALERALGHIGRYASTGSPRYAHELNLPGLRSWPLTRYPHLIFYVECSDHIDVWRVLHGHRDIPTRLAEPSGSE
ncbi:type II toxin-antitoxin system RelE/ParE family toxin [Variovorax paradoxus]|nr:type II toxin-antitoxin system RelE/ParE family toxin [Variovorax paradoxus]MBT2303165.1 type II toxin-antitoxin system RelE/ParE family toxin [Variovorax paradoxus]